MNRFALVAAAALAAALTVPAASLAGGWATVGLSSSPDGTPPGGTWTVDLTILQHGRTPLEGIHPAVRIGRPDGGTERTFTAEPTGEPGVYRAKVVFPAGGEWAYSVDDDFSQVHDFGSARIGAGDGGGAASGASAGIGWPGALGIAAGAGLLAALGSALLRRRPEPRPTGG
jgi:YtkA-like